MMTRKFYTGVAVLLVFLLLPCAVWAEDESSLKENPPSEGAPLSRGNPPVEGTTTPVKITADEISYDYNLKHLTAIGAARLEYKDIKMEADRIIIDQELEMILATGRVHVVRSGDEFNGDRFLYCLQTEQGWVSLMNSNLTDEQLKGPVKFFTEEARLKGEEIDARGVSMTGCDLEKPHYRLTAGRIEYYPEKRIVFHNVWYWEGNFKLLYLPYLVISLEKENFEIDFGWSQMDGWWLYVGYPYEGDNYYGKITTRFTELSPDEYGIVNNHKIGEQKYWYQKFTLKYDGPLTYPSLVGLGYRDETTPRPKWLIDNVDLTGQQFISPGGAFYWKKGIHFGAPGQSPYPSLTLDYSDDSSNQWSLLKITSGWQYNPNPTLSSNLVFNWYLELSEKDANVQTLRNLLDSKWTLNKDWKWSNLLLTYDVSRVAAGEFSHDNLLPQLTYTIPKLTLPWLGDFSVIGQYTNLEKYSTKTNVKNDEIEQTIQTGEREALDVNKSINIAQKGPYSYTWKNTLQYRHYLAESEAIDLLNFSTGINFTDNLTKQLKTNVNFNYNIGIGAVPVLFDNMDKIYSGFTIGNSWNWDSQTLHVSFTDNYNFDTKDLSPATFSLNWTPNEKQQLTFNTSYDWEIQSLGSTNLTVDFKPRDNWILLLALGYDFNTSNWSQRKLTANITQQLSEKWRMELKASYDILNITGNNGGFSEALVGLTYDWHCRELNFHYDYVKQEYWLNLSFKVLPDYKFRVLDSKDLLEYYFNEF